MSVQSPSRARITQRRNISVRAKAPASATDGMHSSSPESAVHALTARSAGSKRHRHPSGRRRVARGRGILIG